MTAAPRAHYVKAIAQMVVGTLTAAAAVAALVINLLQGDPARSIQEQVFSVIGVGLALAAGIELAYTLFTHGPDEALDPLMLGLSAALILQLGRVDQFSWGQGLAAIFYVACLASLFAVRKWLAEAQEPENYEPRWLIKWRKSRQAAWRTGMAERSATSPNAPAVRTPEVRGATQDAPTAGVRVSRDVQAAPRCAGPA